MHVITDLRETPWTEGTVVTIGAYDGVHLGHRAVIEEVKRYAAERGCRSAVVTFDRHPATVVRPESAPRLLTDLAQKVELLAETGIDGTVVIAFDETRANETPEDFVREVLVDGLRTRGVVVGEDFHFGHHRRGNVPLLREIGARDGFEVLPVPLLARADGVDEPVSSTAIRRALAGGDVEIAGRLLGRPYEVRGTVVWGDQRGRLLGFPTANVEVPEPGVPARRRRLRRLVRAPQRRRARLRHQPRPPPHVLRARRPLAARGPPARLLRRPLRRAGRGPLRRASCAASASSTASTTLMTQLKLDIEHSRATLPSF